jgi:hypothetical protein
VKLGITLPVIHINVGQSRDKEFQLLLIENWYEFSRDDFMKTYRELVVVSEQA